MTPTLLQTKDPESLFEDAMDIYIMRCGQKKKKEDEEGNHKILMEKKCAREAAVSCLYSGEKMSQKNYSLFYKAFPKVWNTLAEEGGEFIDSEVFPHLVRNCLNAGNI